MVGGREWWGGGCCTRTVCCIHTYDRGKLSNYMLLDKGDRYMVLNVCIAGRWRKVLYSDSKQF